MFGAKYSRLKFWIWSIVLLFLQIPIVTFFRIFEQSDKDYTNPLIVLTILTTLINIIWINTLANRIRDYGDNPWVALFSIVPLANIGLALYYGIAKSNIKEVTQKNDVSLSKAIYNHAKDLSSEIKPVIEEYKVNHSIPKNNTSNNIELSSGLNQTIKSEDEIYEEIMLEIEGNRKVKSTWAKSLAQSDGDDKKANSLYINLRFAEINSELENLSKRIILEKIKKEEENKINKIKNNITATIKDLSDIENYGYTFISKNILRKNGTWNDYNLVYDETTNIYFVKNKDEILDSFYIEIA